VVRIPLVHIIFRSLEPVGWVCSGLQTFTTGSNQGGASTSKTRQNAILDVSGGCVFSFLDSENPPASPVMGYVKVYVKERNAMINMTTNNPKDRTVDTSSEMPNVRNRVFRRLMWLRMDQIKIAMGKRR